MLKFKTIPVTAYEQNCSLLWCDKTNSAAVIDPGGDIDVIMSEIASKQLKVKQIWLTHGHFDHISGAKLLASRLGSEIIGPQVEDKFLFEMLTEQCVRFNFPRVDSFFPDIWLNDNDSLSLGEEMFSVRHTPGHTPGHIVIAHAASQHIWVGDVLFNNSIGRTDFPRSNYDELIRSIKDKIFSLGDNYSFIPGHGSGGLLITERKHNPFLQDML